MTNYQQLTWIVIALLVVTVVIGDRVDNSNRVCIAVLQAIAKDAQ